jgi:hypothetical protein
MVSRGLGAPRKSWLSSLDDTEFAYVGGSALALLVVLVAGCVLLIRRLSASRRRQDIEPAFAEEYDVLQVIVHAHDQEAELEVQTDAWSSYEEVRPIATLDACPRLVFFSRYLTILCATPCVPTQLRELVVDAVPTMFRDTDELTLEYQDARGRWNRVKMKTPVDTVKAARSARIIVPTKRGGRR